MNQRDKYIEKVSAIAITEKQGKEVKSKRGPGLTLII